MSESPYDDDVAQLRAEVDELKVQLARLVSSSSRTEDEPGTGEAFGAQGHEPARRAQDRTGRRQLLKAAGAAAIGATVVAMAKPDAAGAATGGNMLIGDSNTGTSPTSLANTSSGDGLFVTASSTDSSAVVGENTGSAGVGVSGTATQGDGVYGQTTANSSAGVHGADESSGGGRGVYGTSENGIAIYGSTGSGGGGGVYGLDQSSAGNFGVKGASDKGIGVLGDTSGGENTSPAVQGTSNGTGVLGIGTTGVEGQTSSVGEAGVQGTDSSTGSGGFGVVGSSTNGVGVLGATAGPGAAVAGLGTQGYGLAGEGALAPIWLVPAGSAGAPTTGTHAAGELYVDVHGLLFQCVSAGTPGRWIKVSPLIPINPAGRAYDSRTQNGGVGPLGPQASRAVPLMPSGFPLGAGTALVNLTVTNTVGRGYLTAWEQGQSQPPTSNINWFASSQTVANNATVPVNPTNGQIEIYSAGVTDFIVDVVGYYL